jgi:hypothetical protein
VDLIKEDDGSTIACNDDMKVMHVQKECMH